MSSGAPNRSVSSRIRESERSVKNAVPSAASLARAAPNNGIMSPEESSCCQHREGRAPSRPNWLEGDLQSPPSDAAATGLPPSRHCFRLIRRSGMARRLDVRTNDGRDRLRQGHAGCATLPSKGFAITPIAKPRPTHSSSSPNRFRVSRARSNPCSADFLYHSIAFSRDCFTPLPTS